MKAMLLELKTMFDNQFNIQWSKCPNVYLEGGKLSYEVFALNPKMRYEVFTKMNVDTIFLRYATHVVIRRCITPYTLHLSKKVIFRKFWDKRF